MDMMGMLLKNLGVDPEELKKNVATVMTQIATMQADIALIKAHTVPHVQTASQILLEHSDAE